ncbi:MAG: MFS transporter [Anaerolineales bacterium]|nr:MFS transporter [Anaerolineales bacterium]
MKTDVVSPEKIITAETAVSDPDQFQTAEVFTIVGAHFTHDTYSAFLAPLLPLIQERLATNYALTGSLAIFSQMPSLLNPFIGYLADKISLRYFIILAPGITATLFSSLGLAPNYLVLALLLLAAGISIAAFHAPAPAMIARVSGNRVGKGMSIFMAGGELGRTLGPIVAVAGVSWFGLEGIWRLAFVGWAVSAILYYRLRNISARPQAVAQANLAAIWPDVRRVFGVIIWLVGARVFLQVSLTTYLPIFVKDALGLSLWLSAASLTILEAAGVVGALFTGTLSDRLGRNRMLLILLTASPILYLMFLYGPAWTAVPLLIALGLTAISPQPVMLALVQDSFTKHRALANGIYLAVSFLVRAVGIWVVGMLADKIGLQNAYLWSGLLAFLSIPAVFFLPGKSGNL